MFVSRLAGHCLGVEGRNGRRIRLILLRVLLQSGIRVLREHLLRADIPLMKENGFCP